MRGSSRAVRTIGGVLVACALLTSPALVTGCAPQAATPTGPVEPEAGQSFLGPYPIGVAVSLGQHKLTLLSVEVSDLEAPWPAGASNIPFAPAAEGSKYVHATFVINGKPTPDPEGYLVAPQLIADGKSVPLDQLGAQWDEEPPPGMEPKETLSFQLSESAHSAVLRLKPSFAATQTVAFRLW
jgi:hypothetical protein